MAGEQTAASMAAAAANNNTAIQTAQIGSGGQVAAAAIAAAGQVQSTYLRGQTDRDIAAMQIRSAMQQLAAELKARMILQKLANEAQDRQTQASLAAQMAEIDARIQMQTQELALAREQGQQQYGIDLARLDIDTRMMEAREFANPTNWVQQAYYLRGGTPGPSGPMHRTANPGANLAGIPSTPSVGSVPGVPRKWGAMAAPAVSPPPGQLGALDQAGSGDMAGLLTTLNQYQPYQGPASGYGTMIAGAQNGGFVGEGGEPLPSIPPGTRRRRGDGVEEIWDGSRWLAVSAPDTFAHPGPLQPSSAPDTFAPPATPPSRFQTAAASAQATPGPGQITLPPPASAAGAIQAAQAPVATPAQTQAPVQAQEPEPIINEPGQPQPTVAGDTQTPQDPSQTGPPARHEVPPPTGAIAMDPYGQSYASSEPDGTISYWTFDPVAGVWAEEQPRSPSYAAYTDAGGPPLGPTAAFGPSASFAPQATFAPAPGAAAPAPPPPPPRFDDPRWESFINNMDPGTRAVWDIGHGGSGGGPAMTTAQMPQAQAPQQPQGPAPITPDQVLMEASQMAGLQPNRSFTPPQQVPEQSRMLDPRMQRRPIFGAAAGGYSGGASPGMGSTGPLPGLPANQPVVVGERGPEVLDGLPPGAQVRPMQGPAGGPQPLYNISPANSAGQQALGGQRQLPMRDVQWPSWLQAIAGAATGGAAMPPGRTPGGGGSVYMGINPPPDGGADVPPIGPPQLAGDLPGGEAGRLPAQPQQPAPDMAMFNAISQARQGAISGQPQGNFFGNTAEQMAQMPWLQALSKGIKPPAYQAYSGPLNLSEMPGGAAIFGNGMPGVPAPHQIAPQVWMNLLPSEQQMALGYYRALGFIPEDVIASITRTMPGTVRQDRTFWSN